MSDTVQKICVYVVIGFLVAGLSHLLKSTYLPNFLENNLILLLIALLAINTTTISVVMTKLRELSAKASTFKSTTDQIKNSLIEQVCLIVVSIAILVAKKSQVIIDHVPSHDFIADVMLLAVFVFSIHILYDTANSVFVIIKFEETEEQ